MINEAPDLPKCSESWKCWLLLLSLKAKCTITDTKCTVSSYSHGLVCHPLGIHYHRYGWQGNIHPVINILNVALLNNLKGSGQDVGIVSGQRKYIIYPMSLFTHQPPKKTKKNNNPHGFGAAGKQNSHSLYQERDLKSLQSFRKEKNSIVPENWENKPEASGIQRALGRRGESL